MKHSIKYAVLILLVAFLAYNSIYFKKLDEIKAGAAKFEAGKFAAGFWNEKLIPATKNAPDAAVFFDLLKSDKTQAFSKFGKSMSVGNIKYFLIQGNGEVLDIEENAMRLHIKTPGGAQSVLLATEYIFGNAVRDATGLIDINAFPSSADLNSISAELNQLVRNKVLSPVLTKIKKGDQIHFAGAIELNQKYIDLKKVEIIPVELSLAESPETKPE